jgi:PTH1 family peptidyl-tRNA hydrolase
VKLIVGLGNPGPEYSDTRHNVGFKVAEEVARRHGVKFRKSTKWQALTAKVSGFGDGVIIAQPTTFMNASGWAVRDLYSFHKVDLSDLLVVVDDADLPFGRLRIRMRGSAGGHNGLKSIIEELGAEEFPRMRIGVGRRPGELRNHVLGRFDPAERSQMEEVVKKAADAAEMFVTDGIVKTMNRFNVPVSVQEPESNQA